MGKAASDVRRSIQGFVRAFGLLSGDHTPCGQPLAPSHAHALMALLDRERSEVGQGMKQQDLATLLGLDKSSITRLCTKMIDAGHVQQAASDTDGRVWLLGLSAKGRRVAETVEQASTARFRRLLALLPGTVAAADVIRVLDALTGAAISSSERKTS